MCMAHHLFVRGVDVWPCVERERYCILYCIKIFYMILLLYNISLFENTHSMFVNILGDSFYIV